MDRRIKRRRIKRGFDTRNFTFSVQHFLRDKERHKEVFNIATDLVINNILVSNDFQLPSGLVPYNNQFEICKGFTIKDLDKKIAEEVYNELMKSGKIQFKEVLGFGNKRFDKHLENNDKGGGGIRKDKRKETEEQERKWKRIISEASVYAKQRGDLPSNIERLVDLVLQEKINWKQLLYQYITRELPFDYTYNYPSKKSISSGFYMPSMLRENINVVVSVDTSGSISQNELSEFLVEIINISKSFNNLSVTLIVCDAEIKEVYKVENGNIDTIKNLKIYGGGGTSHIPIYDYIREKLPETKFVINFTDGFSEFPDREEVRTIWVITKNGCKEEDLPFGNVIKLD